MKKLKKRVFAVVNNKGGVCKTTLSKLFIEWFAMRGRKVLGVDLDPQGNLSRRFIQMVLDPVNSDTITPPVHPGFDPEKYPEWDGYGSSAHIYYYGETAIYPTRFENIDFVPAHGGMLLDVERVSKQDVAEKVHDQLDEWISSVKDEYDIIIIDTSPSRGPLTVSAVRSSTHILIPSEMSQMSVEGLFGMVSLWQRENYTRDEGNELELIGILPTKYDSRVPLNEKFFKALKKNNSLGGHLLDHKFRNLQDYRNSTTTGKKGVFELAPSCKSRKEAEQICRYVEEKMYE